MSTHTSVLDVRQIPLWRRLPAILAAFDALSPGDAIELVADLDPSPLHSYLDATRTGACGWQVIETGPPTWRLRLLRQP